jgi:hypothetical protein
VTARRAWAGSRAFENANGANYANGRELKNAVVFAPIRVLRVIRVPDSFDAYSPRALQSREADRPALAGKAAGAGNPRVQ